MKITNVIMKDGSRHFFSFPEKESFNSLHKRLSKIRGIKIKQFLTDQVTEVWIDFNYKRSRFTINNKFGEYWVFSENPDLDNETLSAIAELINI